MREINIPHMQKVIQHVAIRLGEPCMFWGPPGCGKTEGTRQATLMSNAYLCDIRVSQYEGVDFRGIPSVQRGKTVWNLPSTMPFIGNDAFPDDQPILLFFDELNSAQDDGVYAVCYQIIQEGRCGEHVLKPNVRIIAAGNRETDRGVTRRMPLPLSNRMTHYMVVVDPVSVIQHMQTLGVPRLMLAFLSFRKGLISTFDPSRGDKNFATPRTWEKAWRYYVDPHLPTDLKWASISGAVGEGPAAEFHGFLALAGNVTTTAQILADPQGAALPMNDSACWATAMNISGDLTPANADKMMIYLRRVADAPQFGPEYEVAAWQLALRRDVSLRNTDAFLEIARRQRDAFAG